MRKAFSTKLSERAILKLEKVKKETGVPFNRQIEEALLRGDLSG